MSNSIQFHLIFNFRGYADLLVDPVLNANLGIRCANNLVRIHIPDCSILINVKSVVYTIDSHNGSLVLCLNQRTNPSVNSRLTSIDMEQSSITESDSSIRIDIKNVLNTVDRSVIDQVSLISCINFKTSLSSRVANNSS